MKKNGNKQALPGLPAVETITLPDEKRWGTWILVALLLAAGLFFLGRGVMLALTRQGGWTEIQARTGSPGCAGEFEFWYCLDQKTATRSIAPFPRSIPRPVSGRPRSTAAARRTRSWGIWRR